MLLNQNTIQINLSTNAIWLQCPDFNIAHKLYSNQSIINYSVVTGLYLSNTCLTFSDFTKTPHNGKVLKGSEFSLFQAELQQLSKNGEIVIDFAPEWHSRGQRFDPAYLHQNKPQSQGFVVCSLQKNEESDTWIERPWADFKGEVYPGPFSLLGADQRRRHHLRPGWQWQPDKLSRLGSSGKVCYYSINLEFGCSEINMIRHSTFRQIVIS